MNSEMQVITATLQNKIAPPDLMNVDEQVLKQLTLPTAEAGGFSVR